MKSVTILGSFSGRNSGDAAILSAIVSQISSLYPGATFEVPTTNPSYIRDEFPAGRVKPIEAMPWNLSLRLLGVPVFRSVARTDVTLITAGVLNDLRLFNPAFSFLLALRFLIPFAKRRNKSVVCFCVGVGPLSTYWGKRYTKYICNEHCDLIMTREDDSYDLLRQLGVTKPPMAVYADAAFNNEPANSTRINEILDVESIGREKPLVGMNVSSYVGDWLGKEAGVDKAEFRRRIVKTARRIIDELDVQLIFVVTQRMDGKFVDEVVGDVERPDRVKVVSLEKYDNHEIMGILGQLELFVGMRLHSLILASAMHTPVVGINYHKKVGSILRFIGQPDRIIELDEATPDNLVPMVARSFADRAEIRQQLEPIISNVKNRAREATKRLVDEALD